MKKILYSAICIAAVVLVAFSCRKDKDDNKNGVSYLTVRMTDATPPSDPPADTLSDFDVVNVDVKRVEIHNDADGWISLDTDPGIYDLIKLSDGTQVLLVTNDQIVAGHYDQIRLILGSNNTIVVNGITHPLATPSAQQSGLKLNMDLNARENEDYAILLDFDADASVVVHGNGTYSLKPVLHVASVFNP